MEELNIVLMRNNEAVTDSLIVAKCFEKKHKNVIQKIDQILQDEYSAQNSAQCFKKTFYKDSSGKKNPKYIMNRDGFTFLVMGFTGKKANEWKWKYINAFNQMESFIREKSTQAWLETRQQGKITRKQETDTIQKLVIYAKEQGSTHADMLYLTYTKLANRITGIKKRDEATTIQLNNLSLVEHIILNVIETDIVLGKHYKDIYKDCKKRLEQFKDIAYLETAM
jgi:Rha family phage regulatory protein